MGLDLYHLKLQKPQSGQQIELDDWFFGIADFDEETIKILRVSEMLASVKRQRIVVRILICNSDEDMLLLQALEKDEKEGEIPTWFAVDNRHHIDDQIKELEKLVTQSYFERHRYKDRLRVSSGQEISFWVVEFWGFIAVQGVLGRELGYQRGGMNRLFYTSFKNDYCYAKMQDFERLVSFLDETKEESIKTNIEENFIRSFMQGESFLFVSW